MAAAILSAVQQGATYGYAIHRALGDAGLGIRLNHLYPVLKGMEAEGLIRSSMVPGERGPKRRTYALTELGRRRVEGRLIDAIAVVRLAYLDHLAADETTMRRALDLLAKYLPHAKLRGRTAMVVPPGYLSEINFRWFLTQLLDVAQGDIFLVRPRGTFEIDEPRVTLLDGSETYIPLRDGHVEQAILVWIPRKRQGSRPLAEATRIVRPPGILAIILPDALIARDVRIPIGIGAFMEGARIRRTGEGVSEVALEKAVGSLEERWRHVDVVPVPELSFHLLVAWDKVPGGR
jgi:DNA-binding PadR family transcriptional regulator